MKGGAQHLEEYEEAGRFAVSIDGLRYLVPVHCPHRAGRLDHGYVNERRGTVTCPLHHSTFCLRTGAQLAGPQCGPLAVNASAGRHSSSDAETSSYHSFRENDHDALR